MKKNKFKFMFTPNFNEIVNLKRNITFFILDAIILAILFYLSKTEYVFKFLLIRFLLIISGYVIKMIKYSFILIKHRVDVALITSNNDLQDDLYEEYNLINDIIYNTNKEFTLSLEYFLFCGIFYLCGKCYFKELFSFDLWTCIVIHILFVFLVILISYRMEKKFKEAEDKHNFLMFLATSDKI